MSLTRRVFFTGLAGAGYLSASRSRGLILEAVSAPSLPHTLVIPARTADPSGVFELRELRSASPLRLDQLHQQCTGGIFARCGIRLLWWERCGNLRYLFQFESLAARAEAWTAFASDPAWSEFRASVRTAGVSVYRIRID